jgi:RimJ/RimL family protein N-acetyltransferase
MHSKHPLIEELLTERLRMTPARLADLHRMHAHWINAQVREHLWDGRIISGDDAWDAISDSLELEISFGMGLLCLFEKKSGTFVGIAGLVRLSKINPQAEPEIIFSLEPNFWRMGLAHEAASAVLAYAFNTLMMPRVLGGHDAQNVRSQRVLQRLGMQPIPHGPVRSLPYMQVTREDFMHSHMRTQPLQKIS